ncbi:MAG: hypothetical protein SFZ24_11225 [Planctomycetota bacterium]|nr:hypothetical protein [Planctomycetota bacterium]
MAQRSPRVLAWTPTFVPRRALAWLTVVLAAGGSAALGQGTGVGEACSLSGQQSFSAGDEQTMRQRIDAGVEGLSSSTPADASRAREQLMEPLLCPGVTVAFRLKYGDLLEPALSPLASGRDDRVAVNALFVLAHLKTSNAAGPLTRGLASERAPVRFGAAAGIRALLGLIAADDAGFADAAVDRLLDDTGAALAKEADPIVAEGLVLALGDGPKAGMALRARAMRRLTSGLTARLVALRATPPATQAEWSSTLLRAFDLARQSLFEQAASGADREFARSAALMSGQLFAYARDVLARSGEADANLGATVAAAEGLSVIAHSTLTGQQLAEGNLRGAFEAGADRFRSAVEPWIGAQGALLKQPYGAAAGDFAPRP